MIDTKDKQEGRRRAMQAEREELPQATQRFIRSLARTGGAWRFSRSPGCHESRGSISWLLGVSSPADGPLWCESSLAALRGLPL